MPHPMEREARPAIALSGVCKWFGQFQVLQDIDLAVAQGEKIVICGPSGSGKSTLIRCINGLEPFQKGSLQMEGAALGHDARAMDRLRAEVGMVFQSFNLFPHMTILQNCMLAPVRVRGMAKAQARDLAMGYLEKVRISDQAGKYPEALSGGQQQRAAIARALCMSPKIMLFDEPTSALDPELEQEVVKVIKALAEEGRTMIIVTHDMKMASDVSDHVIFLHKGLIEEQGTPSELFGSPKSERLRQFLSATMAL